MKVTVHVNPPTKLPALVALTIAPDATGPLRVIDAAGREVGTLAVELVDPPAPVAVAPEVIDARAATCAGCEHLGPHGVKRTQGGFTIDRVDCTRCKACGGHLSLVTGTCPEKKWSM